MFVGSHCTRVHHHLHLLRTLCGCLWGTLAPLLIAKQDWIRLSTITGLDWCDWTGGLTLRIIFTPNETIQLCCLLSSYIILEQPTH